MTPAEERLVLEGLPEMERIAWLFCRRLPAHADHDAIRGAAREGLVKAARSFDESRGAAFKSYLYRRVTGAMLDECRNLDPNGRRPAKRIESVSLDAPSGSDREARLLLGEIVGSGDFAPVTCARLDLIAALRTLDQRSRLVMLGRLLGLRQDELGRRLGITGSAVSLIQTRASAAMVDRMAA